MIIFIELYQYQGIIIMGTSIENIAFLAEHGLINAVIFGPAIVALLGIILPVFFTKSLNHPQFIQQMSIGLFMFSVFGGLFFTLDSGHVLKATKPLMNVPYIKHDNPFKSEYIEYVDNWPLSYAELAKETHASLKLKYKSKPAVVNKVECFGITRGTLRKSLAAAYCKHGPTNHTVYQHKPELKIINDTYNDEEALAIIIKYQNSL